MKVVCNKAGKYPEVCKSCEHSKPHEKEMTQSLYDSSRDSHCNVCTEWGECVIDDNNTAIKVRCTRV